MLTYNDFYDDYRLDYIKADGTPGFNLETDKGMYCDIQLMMRLTLKFHMVALLLKIKQQVK